jgi:hypothetical protein
LNQRGQNLPGPSRWDRSFSLGEMKSNAEMKSSGMETEMKSSEMETEMKSSGMETEMKSSEMETEMKSSEMETGTCLGRLLMLLLQDLNISTHVLNGEHAV